MRYSSPSRRTCSSIPSMKKSQDAREGACACRCAAVRRTAAEGGEISPSVVNVRGCSSTATNRSAPIPCTGSNAAAIVACGGGGPGCRRAVVPALMPLNSFIVLNPRDPIVPLEPFSLSARELARRERHVLGRLGPGAAAGEDGEGLRVAHGPRGRLPLSEPAAQERLGLLHEPAGEHLLRAGVDAGVKGLAIDVDPARHGGIHVRRVG